MLENIPHWLGSALSGVRAGKLDLASPAFPSGGRLPERYPADGEGVSPPLTWRGVPEGTESLALIVEDPDAPTPRPLVHAIVLDIDPDLGGLPEGAIRADGNGSEDKNVGRNSGLSEGWLPPDPPTGHGSHDYVFQLLALGPGESSDEASPGRGDLRDHVLGRVLAAGVLIGTYSRGEEAATGPSQAVRAPA